MAHCLHCHKETTETSSFLLGNGAELYCNECGWNTEKVARNLRINMLVLWAFSVVGVLLTAWMKESWGTRIAFAIAFVALPFGSGVVTRYRLSKIVVAHRNTPAPILHGTSEAARVDGFQPSDASLAVRPRAIHLTQLGYVYSFGMALATAFVLWVLSFGLRDFVRPSSGDKAKSVFIVFLWSVLLWPCVSFYRNRIRERRLLMNGEFSRGMVMTQSTTQLGSHIVYSYRDSGGNVLQSRATDFSKKLYEEMHIHVFYNPLNSHESAVLEGSLFTVA